MVHLDHVNAGGGIPSDDPPRPIFAAMESMRNAVSQAADLVELLEQRLDPLCRPPANQPSPPETTAVEVTESSSVFTFLTNQRAALLSLSARLETVLDRLEV